MERPFSPIGALQGSKQLRSDKGPPLVSALCFCNLYLFKIAYNRVPVGANKSLKLGQMGLIGRMSKGVKGSLERFFYWWGTVVTCHPYKVIGACLLLTALSSVGFLKFR